MNWRDLLYFSKGERRALALLLCLITISWILLLWTDTKRMPIEAQTDAHRTENRQAPGERRIITGKNTSEGGKNFIRKESGPHPNKTKNTLKDKSPTLTGNNSYPTGKKRKGYTLYTRTEKYAPGTLVELNTADTTILKKVPGIGSTFARRIMKYRELLGGFYDVSQLAEVYGIDEERYPLVHCRHAPCTPVRGQRLTRRRSPQTPLPRLPTGKSDRTAPETKKQALRMGEPATDRRIYRYGQETAHTVPVIQINFKT